MNNKAVKAGLGKFGALVRMKREDLNVSQREFSRMAGVDVANLRRIEAGKANPTARTLARIADGLRCRVWHLMQTAEF